MTARQGTIAETAVVSGGSRIGSRTVIEDYCVVGYQPTPLSSSVAIIGTDSLLRQFTVMYGGTVVGRNFRSGHKANIRENCTIGDDVSIGSLTAIEHEVHIGSRTRIHSQVFIPEYAVIAEDVFVGPQVVMTNSRYPRSPRAKSSFEPPHIGQGAIIGANATLLPGVNVGEYAIVGAGSVVVRDVSPHAVVIGNPAREVSRRSELPYD